MLSNVLNILQSTILSNKVLAASWSELGRVNIWDLTQQLQAVDNDQLLAKYNKNNLGNSVTPLFTFSGHQQEGFAIDWCPTFEGVSKCKYYLKVIDRISHLFSVIIFSKCTYHTRRGIL